MPDPLCFGKIKDMKRMGFLKKNIITVLVFLLCTFYLSGCFGDKEKKGEEDLSEKAEAYEQDKGSVTIGFSQIGSESDWRMASTRSVQDAFNDEERFILIYKDGQQKQENQIKAIREFIDQDVDYILLDPCVETGWDSALLEARDAGIPVIVYDRQVVVSDDSLVSAWIGSDFYLEGEKTCAWLNEYLKAINYRDGINIVNLQGTMGASAQIGRTDALADACKKYPGWNLLDKETGDFTTSKGKEVMELMLHRYGGNINVVYCENDNMAYGAIEAIEKAGYRIGDDFSEHEMLVLSFDSTHDGLRLTMEGKIAVNTECSPLYGPKLVELIDSLERGETPEPLTYINEEQFSAFPGITGVTINGVRYPVTHVDEALIETREY